MTITSYPSPVNKLLTLGDCSKFSEWPNYLELGFSAEHITALIRVATDEALNTADSDSLEVWAPVHAWRTLGQLRAEAAIAPFVAMLHHIKPSDDWASTELPTVLGMIGPAAIPALAALIGDPRHKMYPRSFAGDSLSAIGKQHPAAREECVRSIIAAVEHFEKNSRDLNGFLFANLLDLKAVEAAPIMARAFAAGCVEETIAGDWEDMQIALGLLEARKTKAQYSLWDRIFQEGEQEDEDLDFEEELDDEESDNHDTVIPPADYSQREQKQRSKAAKQKLKNKRAMAAKSRRLNRKKKK